MPEVQNKNKEISFENIEKLRTICKMINEIKSSIKSWKFDSIWPTNLYLKTLEDVEAQLQEVIFISSTND